MEGEKARSNVKQWDLKLRLAHLRPLMKEITLIANVSRAKMIQVDASAGVTLSRSLPAFIKSKAESIARPIHIESERQHGQLPQQRTNLFFNSNAYVLEESSLWLKKHCSR